tara:strand:+ start:281 stop:514 length:234 start_codon:yes stop_codon:yes gene_type:complete
MFFTALISDRYFYRTVKKHGKIMQLWKSLWKDEEYKLIMKDINNNDTNNYENIFNIVKKYHLREDALAFAVKYSRTI